jgi:hypothetical protein
MHNDKHVVWVDTEPAQQAVNILLCGSTIFELKPVFPVSPQDPSEENLVFAVFRNGTIAASFAVVQN